MRTSHRPKTINGQALAKHKPNVVLLVFRFIYFMVMWVDGPMPRIFGIAMLKFVHILVLIQIGNNPTKNNIR